MCMHSTCMSIAYLSSRYTWLCRVPLSKPSTTSWSTPHACHWHTCHHSTQLCQVPPSNTKHNILEHSTCVSLTYLSSQYTWLCQIPPSNTKLEHNHVLEHSLHQLLHEVHHRNVSIDAPHPVNATYGMSKRRRLAGPACATRQELVEMSERSALKERLVSEGGVVYNA